jgi:hypothetical protein
MGWQDMLMRQKNGVLLNKYPFRVIRITITDENNNLVYKRPMWLMVSGARRQELALIQIWQAYKRRYDIEHFFKFGKTRLLMDKFQTPETSHEESWWQIGSLAYAQLYMARELANNLPNPWEKYLPEMKKNATVKSARQVQKSFTGPEVFYRSRSLLQVQKSFKRILLRLEHRQWPQNPEVNHSVG